MPHILAALAFLVSVYPLLIGLEAVKLFVFVLFGLVLRVFASEGAFISLSTASVDLPWPIRSMCSAAPIEVFRIWVFLPAVLAKLELLVEPPVSALQNLQPLPQFVMLFCQQFMFLFDVAELTWNVIKLIRKLLLLFFQLFNGHLSLFAQIVSALNHFLIANRDLLKFLFYFVILFPFEFFIFSTFIREKIKINECIDDPFKFFGNLFLYTFPSGKLFDCAVYCA